jgi:hypothetical protein
MTGKIDRHHAIRLREFRNLVFPKVAIATPAMNEDERWVTLARNRIVNRDAVRRINNLRRRLGLNGRDRKRE